MALEFVVDTIDAVPEALRKFYVEKEGKFYLDDVLAENIRGLKSALDRKTEMANENARKAKEYEMKYSGIDPEKARKVLEMIETNEEARLLAENKFEEAFKKRAEKWRAAEELKQKELMAKLEAAEAKANLFKDKVLEDVIREAAINAGVHKAAIRDSLFIAKTIFTLDENGNAVQKNSDGSIVIGRDGKTPFSPAEWYEMHRVESPHWFSVNSTGSPATGSAGQSGGRQMKRAAFDALPPHEKAATIKNGIRIVD